MVHVTEAVLVAEFVPTVTNARYATLQTDYAVE
jgi:hypothetical protein